MLNRSMIGAIEQERLNRSDCVEAAETGQWRPREGFEEEGGESLPGPSGLK